MGSKAELLKTIETQQKQLENYEKKLKDVIRAYKSLLKEKTALEESVQALSFSPPPQQNNNKETSFLERETAEQSTSKTENFIPREEDAASESNEVLSEDSESSEARGLHLERGQHGQKSEERLATLKQALRTITQEKSRIETALMADKKKLLDEQSALRGELKAQQEEHEKSKCLLEQQLNEVRASLRQSHCERECEQSDHSAMLKELQQKLAQERLQYEHTQKEVTNLKRDLEDKENQPFVYQDRIGELNSEILRLKNELEKAKKQAIEAPQLFQMQKEMTELKAQHRAALEAEQIRALQSEAQIAKINQKNEERVNALETRTSELSSILGEYERQRQQDLAVIEKLRCRVNQLDQENTALTKAASRDCIQDEDWTSLTEKLKKISNQLRHVEQPVGASPLNLYELLGLESPEGENVHTKCRQDYEWIKEEFEKYKLRAQAVLKTKSQHQKENGEVDSSTVEHLRTVIASLQHKLQEAEMEVSRTESRYQDTINGLRHTIAEMQTAHDRAMAELRQSGQQRINDAEREMHKQRERTLEVLSEKESELEALRTILSTLKDGYCGGGSSVPTDPKSKEKSPKIQHTPLNQSSDATGGEAKLLAESGRAESLDSVRSANSGSGKGSGESFPWTGTGEAPNVYYSQELAKKEKEVSYLRRDVRQLESALRDLQHSAVTKELVHYETMEKLKEEIRALESKLKLYREDANMEYLRNVTVKYMLCESPGGKEHMLKAIALVLKLSQKELAMIRNHNNVWYWWNKK